MINGILNIYKEKGYTSHDVVARLRRITGQRKIGHTGTLDPEAEGVLPVCLGRATKVCGMLTDKDKTYEAVLLLGMETDTQDTTGTVLEKTETGNITPEQTEKCILGFVGEYDQIPPMYSAIKVNGKKLYELAREGKTVERKSRRVKIYGIRILEMDLPRVRMEVQCSKGTYIRTLCHDIGENLGVGGCMESLLRTRVERFDIKDSITLERAAELAGQGKLAGAAVPADEMFSDLEKAVVSRKNAASAYNGNALFPGQLEAVSGGKARSAAVGERCRLYDPDGRFIGIYQYKAEKKCFVPEKMFFDPDGQKSGKKD